MARVSRLSVADGSTAASQTLRDNPDLAFVHVDHGGISSADESFLAAAYRDPSLRPLLFELAQAGFMAYVLREGVTSFVHHREVRSLWLPVKEGLYSIDENDVVYSYSPAATTIPECAPAMIVVFSTISPKSHAASLGRHFPQNFESLQKYVSPACSILRIADLGGVTGAYYMNTFARPQNEDHVQNLIRRVAAANAIPPERVLMYGTSKGGTGALLHGLTGGYPTVSVDPIVCDQHYLTQHRDLHLLEGLFPSSKSERFATLFTKIAPSERARIHIVTARGSPQFDVMQGVLGEDWFEKAAVFDVANPAIADHPDVGPNSIHLALMLLNMLVSGLHSQTGLRTVL